MNLQSKNNKSNLRTGLYLVSPPIGNMGPPSPHGDWCQRVVKKNALLPKLLEACVANQHTDTHQSKC